MNVGSGLPDFQCLSSASGSSVMAGRKNKGAAAYGELAAAPLFLRPAITDDPEALASANRTVRGIGGASASGSSVMAGRKNKGAAAYGELAAACRTSSA
ncbi:hypothetical protein MAHJHV28_47360 [Mycobacterium avium subsp. hominissuis]